MALRMNKLVHTNPVLLRRSHERFESDDAFCLWPSIGLLERDPFVCFVDGDVDDNRDKDEKAGKTFSQEDVDRIVQRRLKKADAEYNALKAQLEELEKRFTEKSVSDDELDDSKDGKLSPTKKLERALERSNAKIGELEAKLKQTVDASEAQVGLLKRSTLERQAMAALVAGGVLPTAMRHAMAAFLAEAKAEVEFEESGARFIVNVGGTPYEDDGSGAELSKAAAKWLAVNKHFAKAPEGGGGSDPKAKGPNANPSGVDFEKSSIEDLLSAGLSVPVPTK